MINNDAIHSAATGARGNPGRVQEMSEALGGARSQKKQNGATRQREKTPAAKRGKRREDAEAWTGVTEGNLILAA